jgi:prevent-host-death family protein
MEHRITATELARRLGDILGRIRYRRDSFVVEKNGVPVARLLPVEPARPATVREVIAAWQGAVRKDPGFADALARINAADRPPEDPWAS